MIPLPLRTYAYAGAALLFTLTLGWGVYQKSAATGYRADRDRVQRELVQASAALTGKEAVVTDLRAALATWAENAERMEAATRVAGDRAEAAEAARIALARDLRVRESRNDQIPACAEFLQTDLAAVCPDRAAGLRQRAADSLR